MGRTALQVTESELNRPVKYMVVVADRNIDTHIIDIEEATKYVEKFNRRAIIVSSKEIFKNKELTLLKYYAIMNSTTSAVKLIDHCGKSYKIVFDYINANFKNGLIIAHEDTMTNHIADMLAKTKDKGFDFIIYRQDLMQLSASEISSLSFIRFHANLEFSFTKDNLRQHTEKFGDNIAIGIFTAQMMANYQYDLSQKYFAELSEKYKALGYSEYIDYYELNKQMAYHVFYDTVKSKIIGVSKQDIQEYMEMVFNATGEKAMFNKAGDLAAFYA